MPRFALAAVPEGSATVLDVAGRRVLVCRYGDGVRAMDETCPHQSLSLDGARVRRGSLFCPHHGARFSLEDGRSPSPMTDRPLAFYPATVCGEEVEIAL